MTGLTRRLDALEQIAEELRLRPYREMATEAGIPFDAFMASVEDIKARNDELRARGFTEDQIIEATAARYGVTVQDVRAKTDEILRRYG